MNENIVVKITIDTDKGPIEKDLDLASLSDSELLDLAALVPEAKELYFQRVIKGLEPQTDAPSDK